MSAVMQLESGWSFSVSLVPERYTLVLTAEHSASGERIVFETEDGVDNRETMQSYRTLPQPDHTQWHFFHEKTKIMADGHTIRVVTCPIEKDSCAPNASFMVHYCFEALPGIPAVRISTWFSRQEAMVCQKFSWLHMQPIDCGFTEYRGYSPAYGGRLADIKHLVRFGSLALQNDACWVALTDCGEALWTPKNPEYSPEWVQPIDDIYPAGVLSPWATLSNQVNLALFTEARPLTAVLLFGMGEAKLSEKLPMQSLPVQKAVPGKIWEIKSDSFAVAVKQRPDGVSLAGISLDTYAPTFDADLGVLSRLAIQSVSTGQIRVITSEAGWSDTRVKVDDAEMAVYVKDPVGLQGIAVHVQISIDHDTAVFQTKIHNDNSEWSVLYATYPGIGFTGGNPSAVLPEDSGVLLHHAYAHGYHYTGAYPNGFSATMPCIGLYNPSKRRDNGLYIAVHDAGGARKDITCDFLPVGQGLVEYAFGAINTGKPANAFELAGCLQVRRFSGDWYDFGLIYRDFVHTQASWMPGHGRKDTPQWMKDIPLYIMDWMPNDNPDADPIPISIRPLTEPERDDWYQTPIRLADQLGVPIGYHLYNWHWIPFNNDFPHYFPVKEGMVTGIDAMHRHNIYVMPYINGRLWDTKDRRGEDFRFTKEALSQTSKSRPGMPDVETYASHEPDGSLAQLAAMCPSSPLWRMELMHIVDRLTDECHVDAVYLDQVAAANINLCLDPSHSHTPGNGDWWVKAYRVLMDRLHMEVGDCGFTTESNAEVYADSFDGFLTWAWISSSMVPVFPLIYGGYIAMLGRNTNGYKKDDLPYFRFHVAQAVLFGQQIGWLNPDLVDVPEKLSFMKLMALLRYQYRDFFSAGDMLRPPRLDGDNPVFVTDTGMGRSQMFTGETLLAGAWRLRKDSRVLIMLVNIGDTAQLCRFEAIFSEYRIVAHSLKPVYGDGKLMTIGEKMIECELPPHQCLALISISNETQGKQLD